MKSILFVFFVLFLATTTWPSNQVEFVKTNELEHLIVQSHPGHLKGQFSTVVQGISPQDFNFEILETIEDPSIGTLIMCLSHDIAIAAGMSGSPGFLGLAKGKKLIGAASYAWPFQKNAPYIFAITPIESMLTEAQFGETKIKSQNSRKSLVYGGRILEPIALGTQSISEELIVNLLENRMINSDMAGFLRVNKFVISSSSATQSGGHSLPVPSEISMALPIVANLVEWKDESGNENAIGAMGTTTYAGPEGKVLAFGHPFIGGMQAVAFPMRAGRVVYTVDSIATPFKIAGATSDVLGLITFDGNSGIYGALGAKADDLPFMSVNLQWEGISKKRYEVRFAKTPYLPNLIAFAAKFLGGLGGAPSGEDLMLAEIKSTVTVAGKRDISYEGLYAPYTIPFGGTLIFVSAYEKGLRDFLDEVYNPLGSSNYGFQLPQIKIVANFIPGKMRIMKLGAMKFPEVIIHGSKPQLDFELISDDGSSGAMEIRVDIDKIIWDQVIVPEYSTQTKVRYDAYKTKGRIVVYSVEHYKDNLRDHERQREFPAYFLNADDYLDYLSKHLKKPLNQLFVKIFLPASKTSQNPESLKEVISQEAINKRGSWHITQSIERSITYKSDGWVTFDIPIPPILEPGFVIDPTNKPYEFELLKP